MKLFKFCAFLCFFSSVKCYQPLLDFLNIHQKYPEIDFGLSKECESSLSAIKAGIEQNEIWAIKVQDASGKSQPGFVWGNKYWLGSETSCSQLNNPKRLKLTVSKTRLTDPNVLSITSKVSVEYRMFYASHTSPIQFDSDMFDFTVLSVGLCFPQACQQDEVNRMAEVIFQSGVFKNTAIYGNVKFIKTKTMNLRADFFNETAVQTVV